MMGWGLAIGFLAALGLTGWLRWHQHRRQDAADFEEKVTWLRYYVRRHPEILNG